VVTANKSRKNHQQEVIQKAMKSDHLNKRLARENFNFTDLPYLQLASVESFMHQAKEETDESKQIFILLFHKTDFVVTFCMNKTYPALSFHSI